ncbi:hypothetical protein SAMD00019534_022920, partial [Acytostelium subglobosum LB1]|uniref:hypothetical protein n=1 Tax=Acytostelium subglobosum LB1 TaxID=1410327 RepID=UPI0006449325
MMTFDGAENDVVIQQQSQQQVEQRCEKNNNIGVKPFEQLVANITHEFTIKQGDGNYGNHESIVNLLSQYITENHQDWQDYAFSCPYGYTRNLVAKSDQFELMVICWAKGQVSPIHNHEGQRCWMACAQGKLQETQFIFENTKKPHGQGKLCVNQVSTIDYGSVGYITDDIALHVIESIEPVSVSIHLYSKPIPECNIYCPATGTVTRRKLGFYTQFKEQCPNHPLRLMCAKEKPQ